MAKKINLIKLIKKVSESTLFSLLSSPFMLWLIRSNNPNSINISCIFLTWVLFWWALENFIISENACFLSNLISRTKFSFVITKKDVEEVGGGLNISTFFRFSVSFWLKILLRFLVFRVWVFFHDKVIHILRSVIFPFA